MKESFPGPSRSEVDGLRIAVTDTKKRIAEQELQIKSLHPTSDREEIADKQGYVEELRTKLRELQEAIENSTARGAMAESGTLSKGTRQEERENPEQYLRNRERWRTLRKSLENKA